MPNITLSCRGRYLFNTSVSGNPDEICLAPDGSGNYLLTVGKVDLDAHDNEAALGALTIGDFIGLNQENGTVGAGASILGIIVNDPSRVSFTAAATTWGALTDLTDIGMIAANLSATVEYPEVWQVSNGTTFGDNGALTGNVTLPGIGEVANGTTYGGNGTEFTGNVILPVEGDVANGTGYGSLGTEFTGTLTGLFSASDAAKLDAIYDKLPSSDYLAGSDNADGSITVDGGGGGGGISMVGELLGTVRVVGPSNVSLANVSGLAAFDGSLIVGSSENGTSRFAIGATPANATFGTPIADGASAAINAGPSAADTTSISLSVPTGVTLWLLSYKQPRVCNEF